MAANSHPFLVNEEFIAYLPSLGKALGSVEDAVIVQWLWFKRDRQTDETTATAAEIADAIGMSERTMQKRLTRLKARDVLTARRLSSFNSTSVWSVHLDRIDTDVSAGQHTVTEGNYRDTQSGHPGMPNQGIPEIPDLGIPSSKNQKNHQPTSGRAGGEEVRTTATASADALSGAGLEAAEQERFTQWLQVTGSTAPARLVLRLDKDGTLSARIAEWRDELARKPRTLTPNVVPAPRDETGAVIVGEMCEHDFEAGRCPMCRRASKSAAPALAVPGALGAPDETTRYGVTPSILATSGAHGAA